LEEVCFGKAGKYLGMVEIMDEMLEKWRLFTSL